MINLYLPEEFYLSEGRDKSGVARERYDAPEIIGDKLRL
jgi:hypothetical protein